MKKSQRDLFIALEPAISPARLGQYYRPGDSESDVLARYFWNVCLSESLYPTLGTLEVTLRNSIHAALVQGSGQPDWYHSAQTQFRLEQWHQDEILAAKAKLTKANKPHDPDRIVAELSFGFWTGLFRNEYVTGGTAGTRLWPTFLRRIFPFMPVQIPKVSPVSKRLYDVRTLRNRVSHHEPIWGWRGLPKQHTEILELIQWMNEDIHRTVTLFYRFPQILQAGHNQCLTELEQILT